MRAASRRREPRPGRGSLRSEFLFNLAVLSAAALFLALWTGRIFRVSPGSESPALLAVLVVVDVLIFVALGNYLVDRLVLRPLAATAAVAEAIAGGDYERRAAPPRTREMAALADALNHLTDQLLDNQARLAENVRSLDETNRLLNEAHRDLVQAEKMASIGSLAAGVAHEIGNPLGALLGYVSVLRRRGVEPELVDGMEREGRRIDEIVRGLLDYSRPGSAPTALVDVNGSVERVARMLRDQGALRRVEVELDLDPAAPVVRAAPHRVDQLFVNLFRNAESAMKGDGRISVVTRRERYHPDRPVAPRRADDPPGIDYSHLRRMRHGSHREGRALTADREVVRVVVADTGPGIPPERIQSVFDPFFTTKEPGEGTGLGLAIVAGTVSELGGRIEAASFDGGGAIFTILLPTAAEEAEA